MRRGGGRGGGGQGMREMEGRKGREGTRVEKEAEDVLYSEIGGGQ